MCCFQQITYLFATKMLQLLKYKCCVHSGVFNPSRRRNKVIQKSVFITFFNGACYCEIVFAFRLKHAESSLNLLELKQHSFHIDISYGVAAESD